jgi:hypothetical protein
LVGVVALVKTVAVALKADGSGSKMLWQDRRVSVEMKKKVVEQMVYGGIVEQ